MIMHSNGIRGKLFPFIFIVALIIALFSLSIEVLWIKKIVLIALVLIGFAFSETMKQIMEQIREEFYK